MLKVANNTFILSVRMRSVIMLNVLLLNVMAPANIVKIRTSLTYRKHH